jgi:tetratricopeptide (TPR) repeat protein
LDLIRPRAGLFPLDHGVGCGAQLAQGYWYLGYPDRAMATATEAVERAERLPQASPYSLAFALMYRAGVRQHRREPQLVVEDARRAMEVASANGHKELYRWSCLRHGWGLAELGDSRGFDEMKTALAESLEAGSAAARPHFLCLLADTLARCGRHEEAMLPVSEALAAIEATDAYCYHAEALRLKAEIARRCERDAAQAEALARRAVETAGRQNCRGLQLRAAITLADILRSAGRRAEARDQLGSVVAGFREGFSTGDLLDGRRLLEELEE